MLENELEQNFFAFSDSLIKIYAIVGTKKLRYLEINPVKSLDFRYEIFMRRRAVIVISSLYVVYMLIMNFKDFTDLKAEKF